MTIARDIARAYVYDVHDESAGRFIKEMAEKLQLDIVRAASPDQAINLVVDELVPEFRSLADEDPRDADEGEYPYVLAAGERRSGTANETMHAIEVRGKASVSPRLDLRFRREGVRHSLVKLFLHGKNCLVSLMAEAHRLVDDIFRDFFSAGLYHDYFAALTHHYQVQQAGFHLNQRLIQH